MSHASRRSLLVRILEHDRQLLRQIEAASRETARRQVVAPICALTPGTLSGAAEAIGEPPLLGYLVLVGLLVKRFSVAGRTAVELLGPGDVICTSGDDEFSTLIVEESWYSAGQTTVAVLDRHFQASVARWPGVIAELTRRTSDRLTSLSVYLALAQLPRLEARLVALLWHLADRWGHVERGGTALELPVSQTILAQLVSAQRQSVSSALAELVRRGILGRRPNGGWILHSDLEAALAATSAQRVRHRRPAVVRMTPTTPH